MAIQLLIKGRDGLAAMQARGVKAITLEAHRGDTLAKVSDCHLGRVVEWFADGPAHAPYPDGTLLFYSHG